MYKVGVCGHFDHGKNRSNGQIGKTRSVYKALSDFYGEENVTLLDTCGWKKNPAALFFNCLKLLQDCENIIMMPAQGGIKVFPALFTLLNRKFARKLHYVVIGGWLPTVLGSDAKLLNRIGQLDKVYVELEPMCEKLQELGLDNVLYMPNFRQSKPLDRRELVYCEAEPYPVCTFSRVMREKGIEEAISAVRYINSVAGRTVYTLDIYGKIEPEYTARFEELRKTFEPYISYKGFVEDSSSVNILKNYFAMLFPTFYSGEGLAGTVIDAFFAGVPVVATDWHYNSHIVKNGECGMVYDPTQPQQLAQTLLKAAQEPSLLNSLKSACLEQAETFVAENAVKVLLKELETKVEVKK